MFDNDIVIIIVLYNQKLEETLTYKSIHNCREFKEHNFCIIIYDNSHDNLNSNLYTRKDLIYISNNSNPGLCEAYNEGIRIGKLENKRWLLILDQDTLLNNSFFDNLYKGIANSLNNSNIVAFVPQIRTTDGQYISPCKVTMFGRFKPIEKIVSGVLHKKCTAINSGALIQIDFISDIGGFAKEYPLDMLDHWLFAKIYNRNKEIYCTENLVFHNLSVASKEYMDLKRYSKFLLAERKFYLSQGNIVYVTYLIVLFFRIIKRYLKGQREIAKVTALEILNNLHKRNL